MWQFCAAIVAFATVPTTQGQQEAFAATLDVENTHEYDCFICTLTVEHAFQKNFTSLLTACESLFGSEDVCRDFDVFHSDFSIDLNQSTLPSAARDVCVAHTRPGTCSDLSLEAWRQSPGYHGQRLTESTGATATTMDVRVSKAYGSRGYGKVRISIISDAPLDAATISDLRFTYSEQFKYRWTDKYLSTGMFDVTPGEETIFTIGGENYSILLPVQGDGVRGVIIADPCFTNEFVWCSFGEKLDTFNRTTALLNAINSHTDVHFWSVLGDNFYDVSGEPSSVWFAALSPASKAKVFGSVPGNHDFWIFSAPLVWTKRDQLANGFMQFYGQDVAAGVLNEAAGSPSPLDFSNDPDSVNASAHNLPPASNFFSYYMLGNVGFISYSGAHTYEEMLPYFEEACMYLDGQDAAAVLLQGHWNTQGLGCPSEMNVPETYQDLLKVPQCQGVAKKMRYVMGHMHCNKVMEADVGFMVAGQGMTANDHLDCNGNFGIPVVDTFGGSFSIYYFDIAKVNEYDNYQVIFDCISANGVSNCYHLATEWTSVPLIPSSDGKQ